jgi:hypothetical protein
VSLVPTLVVPRADRTEATHRHSTGAAPNVERRKGRSRKGGGGSGVGAGYMIRARTGGAIAKILAVWGGAEGTGRHRTSCVGSRTSSHKMSCLADVGTYIGRPKTWVVMRRTEGAAAGSRTGGRGVRCLRPRRARSRQVDAFVARQGVGRGGRGGERTCWKLEKIVSGEETKGKT